MDPKPISQYRSFDRSFKAELLIFVLMGPALIALWTVSAAYFYYSGRVAAPLVKASVYFTVIFVFAHIFYGNFRAIARGRSVVIDGDRISKRSAGTIDAVECGDVTNVRPVRLPFIGRWIVLELSPPLKPFRVPIYVRNGHKMVERIFGNLEERGLLIEGAEDLKRYFYDAARRYNLLQKLRDKHTPNLLRAVTAAALLNATAALLYWERGLIVTMIWAFINMLLQVDAYFIAEQYHVRKLMDRKAGADETFARYYVIAGLLALLAGMVFGIMVTEPA